MKRITLVLVLLAFSYSAFAKDNLPKLADVKSLAGIDKINFDSPINKNLDKFNSKSALTSLSLNKYKADKNAYTPKRFNFSINPYIWFMAVGGTVGYYQGEKYAFNKSFSDAVKYLKMAAAAAGKFKYDRVSFLYDISYVNLKGFGTEVPQGRGIVSSNWTVKQTLYDLFLSYLFPSKNKSTMVDIYVGTRIWAVETEATIIINDTITTKGGTTIVPTTYTNPAYSNTWVDPVIGVNSEFRLGKQWFAYAKGDIGGFSVNSQMTWQLTAGAAYLISPNWPVSLGFKYVGVNYDKDARNWTVNDYGPALSIGYRY